MDRPAGFWSKGLLASVVLHGSLAAGLVTFLAAPQPEKSAPLRATSGKKQAGDPLAEVHGETGALTIEPRRRGAGTAALVTPAFLSQSAEPLPAPVRPVVAVKRFSTLEGLGPPRRVPPRLLPPLDAKPLSGSSEESFGPESGLGNRVGTKEATATFFAISTKAKKVVFVLDASSSMGQSDAWNAARREVAASLASMAPETRCKCIVYAGQPRLLLPARTDWLDPTADRGAVVAALEQLAPEGRTEHGPALRMALALQPDAIYFLTDADDLTQEHVRLVLLLNREQIPIYAVELTQRHRGQAGMPMQVLARRWNGEYRAIDLASWRLRSH